MLLLAHNTSACPLPGAMVPSQRVALSSLPSGSPRRPAIPPLRALLIANSTLLETGLTSSLPILSALLIANICPTFFPPAQLRAILIGTPIRLEIDLTRSQQTRKHFLIGTIRPTFTSAPLLTHHSSLITHHCLTSFLFDTNKPHKIIILVSLPMKTKEKRVSIRYKWALGSIGLPAGARAIPPVCLLSR